EANLKCESHGRAIKLTCRWTEFKSCTENLKHYEVKLFDNNIALNTTKVKGNVVVLYYQFRKGFQLMKPYTIKVYSVRHIKGIDRQDQIGHLINSQFKTNVYHQYDMDQLAESIAKSLNHSTDKSIDVSQELAKLSLPWSNLVQKVTLIMSNDVNVFAGNEGKKKANEISRYRDACKATHISTSKCWELTLKEGLDDHYTFSRPDEANSATGLRVQLRFYYELYKHGWYASMVYPISDVETTTSSSGELKIRFHSNVNCILFNFRSLVAFPPNSNSNGYRYDCVLAEKEKNKH
ncbi:hypothetical protein Ciccas_014399, partial [Cichlidogyrus casuarinus]